MSDSDYEPSPKIPRREVHPKKVPNLQMKENFPWNKRRKRILGRNRTRRYRERRRAREQECSKSQSILAENEDCTSDEDSFEASQDVGGSEDLFAGCEMPTGSNNSSANLGYDGNAQEMSLAFPQESQGNNKQFPPREEDEYPLPSLLQPEAAESDNNGEDDAEEVEVSLQDDLREFAKDVAQLKSSSCISDQAMEKAFKLFTKHSDRVTRLIANKMMTNSYKNSVRPLLVKQSVPVWCAATVLRWNGGQPYKERRHRLKEIPEEYFQLPPHDKLLCIEAYTNINDVKEHYLRQHKDSRTQGMLKEDLKFLTLASDGVAESNKGSRTFHAVLLRVGRCCYLLSIFNILCGDKNAQLSGEDILGRAVDQIRADSDLRLRWYVGDTPERRTIKGMISIHGYFSCEMCLHKGIHDGGMCWPPQTMGGTKRTNYFMRRTMGRYKNLRRDDRKGVVGASPLARLAYFDVVKDAPTEEFHLEKEGVLKAMLIDLLSRSKAKETADVASEFSYIYSHMRVFSEMARRTRLLRFKQLKGNELGVIMLGTLPTLASILPRHGHWRYARDCLLVFGFLTRLYYQEDGVYEDVKDALAMEGESPKSLHKFFYENYAAAFCTREDERETINTHHFHHMWEVREHNGPVWKYSGETFESILGILKRLHCPGTRNTPKQIMENHWIHEMYSHNCPHARKMKISSRGGDNQKVDDSLVYNALGQVYVVDEVLPTTYKCRRVLTSPLEPADFPFNLPWSDIGYLQYQGIDEESEEFLPSAAIKGKALLCDDVISLWKMEWLMSTTTM